MSEELKEKIKHITGHCMCMNDNDCWYERNWQELVFKYDDPDHRDSILDDLQDLALLELFEEYAKEREIPKIKKLTERELWAEYKGNTISIDKDGDNYYIQVGSDEGYLYDGYWGDSSNNTFDEALEEALEGSGLESQKKED